MKLVSCTHTPCKSFMSTTWRLGSREETNLSQLFTLHILEQNKFWSQNIKCPTTHRSFFSHIYLLPPSRQLCYNLTEHTVFHLFSNTCSLLFQIAPTYHWLSYLCSCVFIVNKNGFINNQAFSDLSKVFFSPFITHKKNIG